MHLRVEPTLPASPTLAALIGHWDGETHLQPDLTDMLSSLVSLAEGKRAKVLLPLAETAHEFALVRRGDNVAVSLYETTRALSVVYLDREVPLASLLEAAATEASDTDESDLKSEMLRSLAERAAGLEIVPISERLPVKREGGEITEEGLSFEYRALIRAESVPSREGSMKADVHALLFRGKLWAGLHGQRRLLADGPIVPIVERILAAVATVVDAWSQGRAASVRHSVSGFVVEAKLKLGGSLTFTLGGHTTSPVSLADVDVADVAMPALRLAGELLRAIIGVDRAQSRNLRLRSMREEVRRLRREIRKCQRGAGFVNTEPERLRAEPRSEPAPSESGESPARHMRFSERWRVSVDGLDARSTFLCGDRLVIATPRRSVAVSRDDGAAIWVRDGLDAVSFMAGQTFVRAIPDGRVELCSVEDGEAFATTNITPRVGAAQVCIGVGGGSTPPMVVLGESWRRLVAVDARTGEARWRFAAQAGDFRFARAGRVLVVATGEAALYGIDVSTGDVVWKFAARLRFETQPTVSGDTVFAVAGGRGGQLGQLFALDLYSGSLKWEHTLSGAPSAPPMAAEGRVVVPVREVGTRGSLTAHDASSGEQIWTSKDPGLSRGASCLAVDHLLCVNAPAGKLTALDLATGAPRWQRQIADPVADEVPRRLEPILRGGALFAPAASVHVVRVSDGEATGTVPCDLVPDMIRVDERGWVYVAEETGHVGAYAPVPYLSLVK